MNRAAFSRDGRLVATANQDDTARVWRAGDGNPVAVFAATPPTCGASPSAGRPPACEHQQRRDGDCLGRGLKAAGRRPARPHRHRRSRRVRPHGHDRRDGERGRHRARLGRGQRRADRGAARPPRYGRRPLLRSGRAECVDLQRRRHRAPVADARRGRRGASRGSPPRQGRGVVSRWGARGQLERPRHRVDMGRPHRATSPHPARRLPRAGRRIQSGRTSSDHRDGRAGWHSAADLGCRFRPADPQGGQRPAPDRHVAQPRRAASGDSRARRLERHGLGRGDRAAPRRAPRGTPDR